MHRIAALGEISAMTVMLTLILRMFWRGFQGDPVRPSRSIMIAVSASGSVGMLCAVALLLT